MQYASKFLGKSGFVKRTVITSSTTHVLDSRTRMILISGCGGGASGGISTGTTAFGQGGGAAAFAYRHPMAMDGGESLTVTVGVGGAAVTASTLTYGNLGSASSVVLSGFPGKSIILPGGGSSASTPFGRIAAFGIATNNTIQLWAESAYGVDSLFAGATAGGGAMHVDGKSTGWDGGASPFGDCGTYGDNVNATAGTGYGAGGSGVVNASASRTSGAGRPGIIIIEEYE